MEELYAMDLPLGSTLRERERNLNKTKEIVFCFGKSNHGVDPYMAIEQVKTAKVLGVTIDSTLKWGQHIDEICKRAVKRIYILYVLKRKGYSNYELALLVKSLILPCFSYAITVWGGAEQKYIKVIDKILNRLKKLTSNEFNINFQNLLHTSDNSLFSSCEIESHQLHSILPPKRPLS
jgi:hypothetical protein